MLHKKMDVNKLISLVAQRKLTWCEQKNKHVRQEAKRLWAEIGQQMGCSGFLARLKWQNLRDTFRREITKITRAEAEGRVYAPTWKHFKTLAFLQEVRYPTKQKQLRDPAKASVTPNAVPANPSILSMIPSLAPITPSLTPVTPTSTPINPSLPPVTPSLAPMIPSLTPITPSVTVRTSEFSKDVSWADPETDPLNDDSLTITNIVSLKDDSAERSSESRSQEKVECTWGVPSTDVPPSPPEPTQDDEDYHFLMSLLPHLHEIPKWRKLAVRQKLQQVIIEEQVPP